MRTPIRMALAALCMALIAPGAQAATLAPLQVFTDATVDGGPLYPDYELEAMDLVAGFIAETDTSIDFTWQVVDIPDGTGGIPEVVHFYWEFTLDNPNDGKDPVPFSLRARAETPVLTDAGQRNVGTLQSNCTTSNNVVSCTTIPGSVVTVTVDDAADTITASVRRQDLKAGDTELAVDGALLNEADLFEGIASFVAAGVFVSSTGDYADLDDTYVLGTPRA